VIKTIEFINFFEVDFKTQIEEIKEATKPLQEDLMILKQKDIEVKAPQNT